VPHLISYRYNPVYLRQRFLNRLFTCSYTIHPYHTYTMSRFLRTLSTSTAGPSYSQPSNVVSTLPHKVRQRRIDIPHISQPSPINSALPHATPGPAQRFPLKLETEFQALRLKGQFKGDEASARKAFLKGQVAWRSRIRGVSKKKEKSILRGLREKRMRRRRHTWRQKEILSVRGYTSPTSRFD
jgi:hypothetical protein